MTTTTDTTTEAPEALDILDTLRRMSDLIADENTSAFTKRIAGSVLESVLPSFVDAGGLTSVESIDGTPFTSGRDFAERYFGLKFKE